MFQFLKKFIGIPTSAADFMVRGNRSMELCDFTSAIEAYRRAIETDAMSAEAHCSLGTAIISTEDNLDQAIESLDQALLLDRQYAEAFYQRGVAFRNKGCHFLAMDDLREATRLDPNHSNAHALLASLKSIMASRDAAENQEALRQAITEYTEVIRLNPKDPSRYQIRAQVYRDLGEEEKAIQDEQTAAEIRQLEVNAE
jgi:tetratricopeptide (TPR) repeat protein